MGEPLFDFFTGVKPTEEPGVFVGAAATDWGRGMFGGMAVGQAVTAVTRDLPEGRRLHSMHLYYVRPSNGGAASLRNRRLLSERRQHVS